MRTYADASNLFKEYLTLIDVRPLSRWEIREGRRDFMRAFVHHTEDRNTYIDHANYELKSILPSESRGNKFWDFDLISEYSRIIEKMEQF